MRPIFYFLIAVLIVGCAAPTTPVSSPPTAFNTVTPPTAAPPTRSASPTSAPATAAPQPTIAPVAKLPAGALKIVALGDSLTEGDGDDSGKGYPGRLIALIQKIRGGSQIANFGKSGWTSENLIKGHDGQPGQLKQALDAKPHLALVWIGSNDLWYLYEYGNPSGTTPKDEQEDLQNYRKNIETIVSELKKSGAMVFIALLDDQSKRPVALKGQAFTGITKGELDQMSKQVVAYNNAIKDVAAKQGALTVDFFNTKIFVDSATLYSDGNHPNEKGYDLIAGMWFKAMETVLK
jgi:lysophospholipase L1-like esterase